MSVKFSNNGHSTLSASLSSSATSITVASGHGARFPSLSSGEYFYATLIDSSNNLEIVKCTARSSDVLTVTRAQENTTARAYAIGDRIELRVTAQGLIDATDIYDKDSTSTGYFDVPTGTTAQQPAAGSGRIRFDSDEGVVMFSDGTSWFKIAAQVAQLSSISGDVFEGAASTLTLTGSGFITSGLVVNFTQSSDSINEDVTVTPTSDTNASVTVPAAVYNNVTAGNAVSIKVTNSDSMTSGVLTKTAQGIPTGGTVTTSGSTRTHVFTSGANFVVPSGFSRTMSILLIGGGGSGGGRHGGGGGGGGYLEGTKTVTAGTYAIVIGGGAAGQTGTNVAGADGSNSTGFGATAIGGGGGGAYNGTHGRSGGSGGGAGHSNTNGGSATQGNSGGLTGYGNAGANNPSGGNEASGGGGAGASGAAGQNDVIGGAGGAGKQWSVDSFYYSGGGGGGGWNQSGGAGGIGGGGGGNTAAGPGTGGAGGGSARNSGSNGVVHPNNGTTSQGGNGGANTGGGGGGSGQAGHQSYIGKSGNGGSGICVVQYTL